MRAARIRPAFEELQMVVMTRRVLLVLCAAILFPTSSSAQTPSADELVAKNIEARGGEAKLKSLNTARLTGSLSVQGMDVPFTMITKRPNKMRQEMTMQGSTIVQASDGQTVWAINPMIGAAEPRAIEGPQADMLKSQALFDGPLVGYKDRGDTLEVVGPAEVDGAQGWELKLTRKDGQAMHIVLDATTGLERQWTATMEQNGLTMEINTVLSDYQPTDGVQVARAMRTMMGEQQVVALKFSNVEFNIEVDDGIFSMPR
jgi:outer membrane lipoprotein-sorting protein